jgi:hypothetical protein
MRIILLAIFGSLFVSCVDTKIVGGVEFSWNYDTQKKMICEGEILIEDDGKLVPASDIEVRIRTNSGDQFSETNAEGVFSIRVGEPIIEEIEVFNQVLVRDFQVSEGINFIIHSR